MGLTAEARRAIDYPSRLSESLIRVMAPTAQAHLATGQIDRGIRLVKPMAGHEIEAFRLRNKSRPFGT